MKKKKCLAAAVCICLLLSIFAGNASAAETSSGLQNFAEDKRPAAEFHDVTAGVWCYGYVKEVSCKGLMIGKTETRFDPYGNVTLAQTITIAARLHSIYHTGTENFQKQAVWYQEYLDYARSVGITVLDAVNYNRQATRAEFAQILASALPPEALPVINPLSDTAVPDVTMEMPCGEAVYTLYRAGIVEGRNTEREFAPDSNITRGAVSAIICRMILPETRIVLDLPEIPDDGDPDAPAIPDDPDTPAVPGDPGDPGEPDDPSVPDNPGGPDVPDTPDNPDVPSVPDTPNAPGEPDESEDDPVIAVPTFHIQTAAAKAGDKQVAVEVYVKNNPGISALLLRISYDESITLTDVVYNDQLTGETMPPYVLKNPVSLLWISPFADVTEDFLLATVYFDVPEDTQEGTYLITAAYNPNDVYELSEENVYFDVVPGAILVTK